MLKNSEESWFSSKLKSLWTSVIYIIYIYIYIYIIYYLYYLIITHLS